MATMTPEFSRAAAQIADSPYWQGAAGFKRWHTFLAVIERFPTYDRLPKSAKQMWQDAVTWQETNHAPDPWGVAPEPAKPAKAAATARKGKR